MWQRTVERQSLRHIMAACQSYLIDLIITQVLAIGNVLSADLVVHIGLDSTRSNAVHRDFLITEICYCQHRNLSQVKDLVPIAMHRTNVSMAPLLPEYTVCFGTPLA